MCIGPGLPLLLLNPHRLFAVISIIAHIDVSNLLLFDILIYTIKCCRKNIVDCYQLRELGTSLTVTKIKIYFVLFEFSDCIRMAYFMRNQRSTVFNQILYYLCHRGNNIIVTK